MAISKLFLAGHEGMVGSAILRALGKSDRYQVLVASHSELDLTRQADVEAYFALHRPDAVILAAARVGGILANGTRPAEFIYENLAIECNLIHAAHGAGVQRLLFLGSSCIYPASAAQPIPEEALLTGPLEPTNEPYAIAKIAGIKLCESYNRQHGRDYRSVMPTNLYGPNDNFHAEDSHVIPALIRRFHEAVETGADSITIWGSGRPRREFLHVDDAASACLHVLELDAETYGRHTEPMRSHLNVGAGKDCTIAELAAMIARVSGFKGEIRFDTSRPDGVMRKLLDSSRLNSLGWQPRIGLEQGLRDTWHWYVSNRDRVRR